MDLQDSAALFHPGLFWCEERELNLGGKIPQVEQKPYNPRTKTAQTIAESGSAQGVQIRCKDSSDKPSEHYPDNYLHKKCAQKISPTRARAGAYQRFLGRPRRRVQTKNPKDDLKSSLWRAGRNERAGIVVKCVIRTSATSRPIRFFFSGSPRSRAGPGKTGP